MPIANENERERARRVMCLGCSCGLPAEYSDDEGWVHRTSLGGIDEIYTCLAREQGDDEVETAERIAQSYAEVREEAETKAEVKIKLFSEMFNDQNIRDKERADAAEAKFAEAKRLLQTQQDLIDSYRMGEERAEALAHRAGMEEAAMIADGFHTAQAAAEAIRAAMKEGTP